MVDNIITIACQPKSQGPKTIEIDNLPIKICSCEKL